MAIFVYEMKQIFFILVFFVFTGFAVLLFPALSSEGVVTKVKKSENIEIPKQMEEVSETLVGEFENMDYQLDRFFESQEVLSENSHKKYETLLKTVDNYIERYIKLFLITSDLLNRKIKDSNEMITIDLEISITGQDLAYLQNYSKSSKYFNYQKNLSKLDGIFSKIARLKARHYAEKGLRSSMSLLASFLFSSLSNPSFYRFFSFISIMIAIWMSRYYMFHKSFYMFLAILINSVIIWEGLNLYLRKIKEEDLKIYVQTLQFKSIPEECDPARIRWYHSIVNLFTKDKCLQYFETLNKNAADEVSLFMCIIETYILYFIRAPAKFYGMTIRDLTDEFSASWPWPLKPLLHVPLVVLFAVMGGFFILILYGKQLRLSFFGASVEIGDVKTVPEMKPIDNFNSVNPKQVRVIRKLKPWTKSRFPRRLEGDLGRWKKLCIKSSRSMIEMPESCQTFSGENASSVNEAVINDEKASSVNEAAINDEKAVQTFNTIT